MEFCDGSLAHVQVLELGIVQKRAAAHSKWRLGPSDNAGLLGCGHHLRRLAGGENAAGNWSLMAGLMLLGFFALVPPCGGSFGLPKVISLFTGAAFASVIVAAVIAPPTAVAANMSGRKTSIAILLPERNLNSRGSRGLFVRHHIKVCIGTSACISNRRWPANTGGGIGTARSFGGRRRCFAGSCLLPLFPE